MTDIEPTKDDSKEGAIASCWRATFKQIVASFIDGDYLLKSPITGVSKVSEDTANQIKDYITDYGESLAHLPDDTWSSSVCIWLGNHWDVIIDLYTIESGLSDMVLQAKVFESNSGYSYEIHMVYVP